MVTRFMIEIIRSEVSHVDMCPTTIERHESEPSRVAKAKRKAPSGEDIVYQQSKSS